MWNSIKTGVTGGWNWFLGSPIAQIGAALLGLIVAWSATTAALKAEGRREQKRIHDAANANARAEMLEDRTEILDEIHNDVEGARAAVERMPQFTSLEQLRQLDPELAALIEPDPS